MGKVISKIKKSKFGRKLKEFGSNLKNDIAECIAEDPSLLGGIGFGLITIGYGVRSKYKKAHEGWVEDKVTGLEFKLKHQLSNSEIEELGEKLSSGENLADSLREMDVLAKERKRRR